MVDQKKNRFSLYNLIIPVERSIFKDIIIGLVLIVTLVSTSINIFNYFMLSMKAEQQYNQKADEYIIHLQDSLEIPIWNIDDQQVSRICESFLKNEFISKIKVTDSSGNILLEISKKGESDFMKRVGEVTHGNQVIGHVELGLTPRLYNESRYQSLRSGMITLLAAILVVIGATGVLLKIFMGNPLNDLIDRMDRMAKGSYEYKNHTYKQKEIKAILSRFNHMAEQIRNREEALIEMNMQLENEIRERKKAEEERVLLTTAIDQANETIVVTDTKGKVLYANPAFEKTSGYRVEEAIGQNPHILKSGNHDRSFYDHLWNTISHGEVWRGHFINKKKDGSLYHEETSISPVFDSSGKIVNYVAVKRDVTREISLEKQLRQSQKMEAIGTLAGGIAHDFNNILGAIVGYTELALTAVPAENKCARYLDGVLKASNRAKDLVQQILAFSRQTEQERKPIELAPIVKEALRMLRSSLPTTIEIKQEIHSDEGVVLADPTQIHQILMNLCTNAAQAMQPNGGVLKVGLSGVTLNSYDILADADLKPGPYLRLSVSDTGRGIEPSVMPRIFDPYFTTKAPGEGTGLGLSVVHGIVKNHGGTIKIYSEPGKGSTFHVYLPLTESETKEPFHPETKTVFGGNERILFVDDEAFLTEIGREIFEHLGYEITTETSSVKALGIFKEHPDRFDLVITDMTMPQMTGIDLAGELLSIRPDIPVILCTGFSSQISEEKIKAMGIRRLLMKPLLFQQVADAVREVLDQKRG